MKKYSKIECLKKADFDSIQNNVAVKEFNMSDGNSAVRAQAMREIGFLQEMKHDNIIRLLEVVVNDDDTLSIVLEFTNSDLKEYLKDHLVTPMDSHITKSIMHQILSALSYCHDRKIVHRDVKPSNIHLNIFKNPSDIFPDIVDNTVTVKLGDFGSARSTILPWDYTPVENVESLWYRAPELIFGLRDYYTQVDVWSVGCVFAEMVGQKPLFAGSDETDQLSRIFRIMGTPNEENWPGITLLFADLNKFERTEAMNLTDLFPDLEPAGLDLLSRMLCLNPSKRISACDALEHAYFETA